MDIYLPYYASDDEVVKLEYKDRDCLNTALEACWNDGNIKRATVTLEMCRVLINYRYFLEAKNGNRK